MKDQYIRRAEVLRVVDGDTYELRVDLGFDVYVVVMVRLADIDTPESYRPRNDAEAMHAYQCEDFVIDHLMMSDNEVYIKSHGKEDKYGRWICDIYPIYAKQSLSTTLKEEGYEKRDSY